MTAVCSSCIVCTQPSVWAFTLTHFKINKLEVSVWIMPNKSRKYMLPQVPSILREASLCGVESEVIDDPIIQGAIRGV